MKEIKDWEMVYDHPYELWILNGRWYCVNEVVVLKNTYDDDTVKYVVSTTEYPEVVKISEGYRTILSKLEMYYDVNYSKEYDDVAVFDSYEEAINCVNENYQRIDIKEELDKHYQELNID